MTHLKHIVEGALYTAAAAFVGSVTVWADTLHYPEPWSTILVGAIGVLTWARSWLEAKAAAETTISSDTPSR